MRATRNVSRILVIVAAILLLVGGLWLFRSITLSDGLISVVEWIALIQFAILFGWIAFSFSMATLGFIVALRDRISRPPVVDDSVSPESGGSAPSAAPRTAILMPVYNESPFNVMAGVNAMIHSLHSTGEQDHFDVFMLSDTTKPEIEAQERQLWELAASELRSRFADSHCRLYYRHREKNIARKSGNIADFCERWGAKYQSMIVLDADSLVDGQTMAVLRQRMVDDPHLGILQVVPVPIGRTSLFARLQQFSADVYGPVYARGFAAFTGSDSNYFGHNAILRIAAFKEHCALPVLPGREPLGGEILSHDFVEAALMLRAGYKVEIATDLDGSYEECPTTISDFAKRDQRWCQGNMQHTRLIVNQGFHPMSRWHFFTGVLSYSSALLWVLFLVTTIVCMVTSGEATGTGARSTSMFLFVISMLLLLTPKFWGVVIAWLDPSRAGTVASAIRIFVGMVIEIVASMLMAPIMALLHSRFVLSVFLGKTVQWKAQQRSERGVSWGEAARDYGGMTVLGIVATAIIAWSVPSLLIWFSPFLLGLVFAIPLVVAAGSQQLGQSLGRFGLLNTQSEIKPPSIQVARDRLLKRIERDWSRTGDVDEAGLADGPAAS